MLMRLLKCRCCACKINVSLFHNLFPQDDVDNRQFNTLWQAINSITRNTFRWLVEYIIGFSFNCFHIAEFAISFLHSDCVSLSPKNLSRFAKFPPQTSHFASRPDKLCWIFDCTKRHSFVLTLLLAHTTCVRASKVFFFTIKIMSDKGREKRNYFYLMLRKRRHLRLCEVSTRRKKKARRNSIKLHNVHQNIY